MSSPSSAPFTLHRHPDRIAVEREGTELFQYVFASDDPRRESPRPYAHPVRTPSGREVGLNRPHDHRWHKGISWALPNVRVGEEVHNFWGGPTYLREDGYRQLENNGEMRHLRETEAADGETAVFAHELTWYTEQGRELIAERRRLTATAADEEQAWLLGFETELTNTSGEPIAIGSPTTEGRDNAGYAGLFWRGPRSFTDAELLSPAGVGGEELRGERHPWLGLIGRHDGDDAVSTILMIDAPDNLRHPPRWFARSAIYGCLNPAPFFDEELVVAPGETVRFRYAVAIADGAADAGRGGRLAAAGGGVLGRG